MGDNRGIIVGIDGRPVLAGRNSNTRGQLHAPVELAALQALKLWTTLPPLQQSLKHQPCSDLGILTLDRTSMRPGGPLGPGGPTMLAPSIPLAPWI